MSDGENAEPLPPLLFAGAYITGGIVGYDSDTKSGGIGARILGVQANTKYRQDVVTIILRLVNVQSGEVVISTTIEKTIFSTGTGGDVFKYFDADTMLLESEAGVARNEPVTFAVRKAIEAGVAEIIQVGAKKELWKIKLPPEPVLPEAVEESDAEVVTEEKVTHNLKLEQGKPEKIKTRAEYLAEKKAKKLALLEEKKAKKEALEAEKLAKKEALLAKKHLKKVQKNELAWYNKANSTKFKTWDEYQVHLRILVAFENKAINKEERRNKIRTELNEQKVALEVADESVIIESNTVTSNSD
jgi:hypothetical protein